MPQYRDSREQSGPRQKSNLHGEGTGQARRTQAWPILDREAMVKSAAARRATRRLPLGEPPLVITTHAITSFREDPPVPLETSLERERASVRRATVARHESRPNVCVRSLDRHPHFIRDGPGDQPSSRKTLWGSKGIEPGDRGTSRATRRLRSPGLA